MREHDAMMWTKIKAWTCALAVLALAIGAAALLLPSKPAPPKEGREAEVEALNKKVDQLRQELHKIGVASLMAKDVVVSRQYVVKTFSQRHIDIRAPEEGYVIEAPLKEGRAVKKGDVIFKIVPTLYKARLDAELAEAMLAELEWKGAIPPLHWLIYIDPEAYRRRLAAAWGRKEKAQDKLKRAEAELNLATVKAPFDGIVDRLHQQRDELVKNEQIIATVSDRSVMWVYFDVPEARYFEFMPRIDEDKEQQRIELVLANGGKFKQTGKIGAIETKFDNETGNISCRADFPNPDRLSPQGQAGTVLIHRTLKNAIVIPRQATFENLGKRYVFVVGKDDVGQRREIVIQHELADFFVIKKGLDVNDRIVVEGVQQVRDGERLEFEYSKFQAPSKLE